MTTERETEQRPSWIGAIGFGLVFTAVAWLGMCCLRAIYG